MDELPHRTHPKVISDATSAGSHAASSFEHSEPVLPIDHRNAREIRTWRPRKLVEFRALRARLRADFWVTLPSVFRLLPGGLPARGDLTAFNPEQATFDRQAALTAQCGQGDKMPNKSLRP